MRKLTLLLAAAVLCPGAFAVLSAETYAGDLTGQIVFDGAVPETKPVVKQGDATARDAAVCAKQDVPDESLVVDPTSKGIANCFVYLRKAPKGVKIAPPAAGAVVKYDNINCRFEPHVLAVQAGQSVTVTNSDAVAHNVHTYPLKNVPVNFLVQPMNEKGVAVPTKQDETLPFKVTCDIHPWMTGYWFVAEHPFVAVTDKDGKFEIKDLPAGRHEFRIWHERAGYVEKSIEIEIKAGANEMKTVKASPNVFKK